MESKVAYHQLHRQPFSKCNWKLTFQYTKQYCPFPIFIRSVRKTGRWGGMNMWGKWVY